MFIEGLMLKLKFQYLGPLRRRADSLEKTLMQEEKGMTEDEMVGWHHQLDGQEFEQALKVVMDRGAWCVAVHGVAEAPHGKTIEQLN